MAATQLHILFIYLWPRTYSPPSGCAASLQHGPTNCARRGGWRWRWAACWQGVPRPRARCRPPGRAAPRPPARPRWCAVPRPPKCSSTWPTSRDMPKSGP
ncbi:MAG: hypothetical protein EOO59_12030 [Hymenobacter sp.]|nr:MAG: hypothetical protein EOO59_12030 [Hymenobacter sp.]